MHVYTNNFERIQPVIFHSKKITVLRGAVFIKENLPEEIDRVTQLMLKRLKQENKLHIKHVIAMVFSVTNDITAKNPATSAREAGFDVPLFCVQEAQFENSPKACIRLMLWYAGSIKHPYHVYCEGAEILRPDITSKY